MTHQLVIHLPDSSLTLVSDNPDKIDNVTLFCLETLDAYNGTGIPNELIVDVLDEELSNQFYSLLFELGLL